MSSDTSAEVAGRDAGNGAASIGQALASNAARIEAVRAAAEVQAQVLAAQALPRNMQRAIKGIKESCRVAEFAERAFYRYPRGTDPETGQRNFITGPSVYLARELARLFGNVQYGIAELARDDQRPNGAPGMSEMNAWAWDVETNTRSSTTFLVPHARDARGQRVVLIDLRDVYENNANQGARRLRQMILAILPPWYVELATDTCRATIAAQGATDKDGNAVPLDVRLADAAAAFERWSVRLDMLEAKLGAPFARWVEQDLATLRVIYRSLTRNETSVEDEFPSVAPAAVSAAQVDAQAGATEPPAPPADEPPADMLEATRTEIDRTFADMGWLGGPSNRGRRQAVVAYLAARAGVPAPDGPVRRWKDLSEAHGQAALSALRWLRAVAPPDRDTLMAEIETGVAEAATVPPEDGKRPATVPTRNRLRARFAREGVGLAGEDREHDRLSLIGALLTGGHWRQLESDEALGEEEALYAIRAFDSVAAAADKAGEPLGDALARILAAAYAERDAAADEAEITAGTPGEDDGGEEDPGDQ